MRQEDVTFVVAGPVITLNGEKVTENLICDLNTQFPLSKVILTTWNGEKLPANGKYHPVVSNDPGTLEVVGLIGVNAWRMIYSMQQAIEVTDTRYLFRLRSDMLISKRLFTKLMKYHPNSDKITIFWHSAPFQPYLIDDKALLGTVEKIQELWGIEKSNISCQVRKFLDTNNKTLLLGNQVSIEQVMYSVFLKSRLVSRSAINTFIEYNRCTQEKIVSHSAFSFGLGSVKFNYENSGKIFLFLMVRKLIEKGKGAVFAALPYAILAAWKTK